MTWSYTGQEPGLEVTSVWDCEGDVWERVEGGWQFARRSDGTRPGLIQAVQTWDWLEQSWGPVTVQRPDQPGQPDGIEDDSRDLPDPARAAERVGRYISAVGDGLYAVQDGAPLYGRDLEAICRAVLEPPKPDAATVLEDPRAAELVAKLAAVRHLCEGYQYQPPPLYRGPGLSERGEGYNQGMRDMAWAVLSLLDTPTREFAQQREEKGESEQLRAVVDAAMRWRAQFGEWGPLDSAETPGGDLTDAVDALLAARRLRHHPGKPE
jgi:hypothetical protein